MNSKDKGFTLIELMVSLAILGILVGMAVPSYQYVVQNTRALTLTSDFTTSLSLARSEALKRSSAVTVCAAVSGSTTACSGNTNWTDGWIVFVDPDGNGVVANAADRIKVHEALNPTTTFTTTQSRVTYNATGFLNAGAGAYTLSAPGCTGAHGRLITLSNTGRPSVTDVAC